MSVRSIQKKWQKHNILFLIKISTKFIGISLIFFLFSCKKEENGGMTDKIFVIPQGFPMPNFPSDNEFSEARFQLGKQLFYDPILSKDSTVSCASCHQLNLGFTDGKNVSEGIEKRKGTRNALPLFNLAYHPYFLREGGVPTLEMQVLVPIQEHNEMDFNLLEVAKRLNNDSNYIKQSWNCYQRKPDPFVITRAIANFERVLISGNSDFDKAKLSKNAQNGKTLFFSDRLNCAKCHNGFNFTNYAFENNGLYETYVDEGRFRLTNDENDRALFKVPSLRNVAITAPYMHDGSLKTLEEVIEHYNKGGYQHPNKSDLIKPLFLSSKEKQELIAFLNSLTDYEFLSNYHFENE